MQSLFTHPGGAPYKVIRHALPQALGYALLGDHLWLYSVRKSKPHHNLGIRTHLISSLVLFWVTLTMGHLSPRVALAGQLSQAQVLMALVPKREAVHCVRSPGTCGTWDQLRGLRR